MTRARRHAVWPALSLVEVLMVTAVLGVIVGLLMPGVAAARRSARQVRCATQVRELALANQLYAASSSDAYCPGAARFDLNLDRWHGRRTALDAPFDGRDGPLAAFIDGGAALRACPSMSAVGIGFEAGAGGYGYNNDYIGVRLTAARNGGGLTVASDLAGAATGWVARPGETVMFTDAALAGAEGLIEYGFAHARFVPAAPQHRWDPSIHFRHDGRANVAWVDGHVDARERTMTWHSGFYPTDPDPLELGWFGDEDTNTYFDLD